MRASFLSLFSLLSLVTCVLGQSGLVDDYVNRQTPIAKAGVIANIGPDGAKAAGARAGLVVASPSTHDPDYLYTWTRDSALVFKFIRGEVDLRRHIDNYFTAQRALQQVSNPSGTLATGGLGEPKFNIDGSAFTGSWGRPQRDGPPLRAMALITYAEWLIANGNVSWVSNTLWPVLQLDLDYTMNQWNQSTFDLWEEVSGRSFFTTAVQHRALRTGSTLATKLGRNDLATAYNTQTDNTLCFLQSYWNPSAGYVTSNVGGNNRSGKDANSVLASIHTFDPEAGCDAATFQPCSDKALSNLKVYVDSFRSVYAINRGIASTAAVATGRYPEDIYYGGQPWYLTVSATAEQLYDALIVWNRQGSLTVTSTSLAFFRQFSDSVSTGTYAADSSTFQTLTTAVKNFADGFVAVNAKYTPSNGALAEQFHRDTGVPLSAKDLTWSYASTLTSFDARQGVTPPSWGAKGLAVPSVCVANPGPTVQVTFKVQAETQLGENMYITGSLDALANWSPDQALRLSPDNYPIWSITVRMPANANFDYKYIRKGNGGVTWEQDPNNSRTTPATGSTTFNDRFRP